jgi:hypothetical protein
MWILPKNYPLSSHFAQDMVVSSEDLTLPGLNIESSLLAKSKPTRLRTWQTRWKQGNFYPHLFTRILKPSRHTCFETKLTSLLAAIHVSPLVQQDSEKEQMIQGTCGLTLGDTLNQLDLFSASLKTSRDISVLDSEKSLATWKALVTKQRGEYSQRVKLALLTREKESTSWATPNTMDHLPQRSEEALVRQATTQRKGRTKPANLREQVNPTAVAIYQEPTSWPTPTVQDGNKATKKMRDNHQNNLTAVVFSQEAFPTPTTRDWKGGYNEASLTRADGKSRRFDALPNAAIGGVGTDIVPGHLNPEWVEWLMGVPTGWTELGCWGTE